MNRPSPQREQALDFLRGIAILLMFFFTLNTRLCSELSFFLQHNLPNSLKIGDFVFPLFLFVSGCGIGKGVHRVKPLHHLFLRAFQLILVGMILSPYTTGQLFGIDEVCISGLLLVPTTYILRFPRGLRYTVFFLIPFMYFVLAKALGVAPYSGDAYLGGWRVIPFYLPIPIAGGLYELTEKREFVLFLIVTFAGCLLSLIAFPPTKIMITPSFVFLSVVVVACMRMALQNFNFAPIAYIGRKPLHAWICMFTLFVIPLSILQTPHSKTVAIIFNAFGIPDSTYSRLPNLLIFSQIIGNMVAITLSFSSIIIVFCLQKIIHFFTKQSVLSTAGKKSRTLLTVLPRQAQIPPKRAE